MAMLLVRPLAAQSLAALLDEYRLSLPAGGDPRASREITSYAVRDGDSAFAVAFYWKLSPGVLDDSLNVAVYHKAAGSWRVVAVERDRMDSAPRIAPYTLGSAIKLSWLGDHLLVDTHRTPSAGTLLVLDRNLRPVATLKGWSQVVVSGGKLVYHRNMVHFAATHPAELWIFDPATGGDTMLYPTIPYQDVRRRYVEQVRDIYARLGEDWFRQHNHHMMADRFDSSIGTPLVDERGERIAFVAVFGDNGGARASPPMVEVLVVCDSVGSAPRCAETELSAMRAAHPDWSSDRILRDALAGGYEPREN
jgi:hypothetical protein